MITKNGTKISKNFFETMQLDDGSIWIPICVHNAALYKFFSTGKPQFNYVDDEIWSAFGLINTEQRPESDWYEFLVMEQNSGVNGPFTTHRWKQNVNPFNASWSDINPSKVGTNVINISNGTAGMYCMNSVYTYMCFAGSSAGSWYGCGIKYDWQGTAVLPGYGNSTVYGFQLVYMRVSGSTAKEFKGDFTAASQFTERITLDDNSVWVPICAHYVPAGLFTVTNNITSYYKNDYIWSAFGAINSEQRPETGWYEFMVLQQRAVDGPFDVYRWKQNTNPLTSTWQLTNPSNEGTNVVYINTSARISGGMYYKGSLCTMCFANNSSGNWFGCGISQNWSNGIPGYNNSAVKGWQLVYMRVENTNFKIFKGGRINAAELSEE